MVRPSLGLINCTKVFRPQHLFLEVEDDDPLFGCHAEVESLRECGVLNFMLYMGSDRVINQRQHNQTKALLLLH
jgi:hypothetical protein